MRSNYWWSIIVCDNSQADCSGDTRYLLALGEAAAIWETTHRGLCNRSMTDLEPDHLYLRRNPREGVWQVVCGLWYDWIWDRSTETRWLLCCKNRDSNHGPVGRVSQKHTTIPRSPLFIPYKELFIRDWTSQDLLGRTSSRQNGELVLQIVIQAIVLNSDMHTLKK